MDHDETIILSDEDKKNILKNHQIREDENIDGEDGIADDIADDE